MLFSKKLFSALYFQSVTLRNVVFGGVLLGGVAAGGMPFYAQADEASDINAIKSNLEKRSPPLHATSIKLSPLAGLYEAYVNGNIFYVDKSVSYVIVGGSLLDATTKQNITAERLKELSTIKFETLPFKNAIEIKKGNGAYKFAVFSDPDCPYCKTLEQGLENSGVTDYTAYVFLFPLKEIHPNAAVKAESIWCSKDRNEAWLNWMIKGTEPVKAICDNPMATNEKLAQELGVGGTPTIYLNNGKQTQAPQELIAAIKDKK